MENKQPDGGWTLGEGALWFSFLAFWGTEKGKC